MTGKELIHSALESKPTPRIPVALLDGFVWMLKREQLSFKDIMNMPDGGASVVLKAYDDFGVDNICTNAHSATLFMKYLGGEVRYEEAGQAFEVVKAPLKNISDIKDYSVDAVMEQAMADPEFMSVLHLTKKMREYYGENRSIWANTWAPFTFASMMLGTQYFMEQMLDDEDETQMLVDFASELIMRYCELMVEYGADVVMICDPVASGDMISPVCFDEQIMPVVKKSTAYLQERGVKTMMHICGNTVMRLQPLLDAGIAGLSMDGTNITKGLAITRGNYALMGNMNPFEVLQKKTAQEVYDHCYALCQQAGLFGGFIMMPGCDLAPGIPLENIQAMVRAAHDYSAK